MTGMAPRAVTKARDDFDPQKYATVAERIRLFYDAHPAGRILTELVSRTRDEVVFKALVFRTTDDAGPAATGWAVEREGDGDVNQVACLENTETSAIGRALANLGFTASRQRASAEEMAKVSRERVRQGRIGLDRPPAAASASPLAIARDPLGIASGHSTSIDGRVADATRDALNMVDIAERAGLDSRHIISLRWKLDRGTSLASIRRLEATLRQWLLRRDGA